MHHISMFQVQILMWSEIASTDIYNIEKIDRKSYPQDIKETQRHINDAIQNQRRVCY